MGRYDTTMNILGMLGQSVNAVQNRNLQESIATNQLNENKRTFDLNMGFQTDARDWTRRLTGEARDRSEQELLVDTEVSKNPYKFAKGWRKTVDGKIEPYAYELSKDQIKRMSNQNNGFASQRLTFSTVTPDGKNMIMSDGSIVPLPQTAQPQQSQQDYSQLFYRPMIASWFTAPFKGLQTGIEPVFNTTGGTQVSTKTKTVLEVAPKSTLQVKLNNVFNPSQKTNEISNEYNNSPAYGSSSNKKYWWE